MDERWTAAWELRKERCIINLGDEIVGHRVARLNQGDTDFSDWRLATINYARHFLPALKNMYHVNWKENCILARATATSSRSIRPPVAAALTVTGGEKKRTVEQQKTKVSQGLINQRSRRVHCVTGQLASILSRNQPVPQSRRIPPGDLSKNHYCSDSPMGSIVPLDRYSVPVLHSRGAL